MIKIKEDKSIKPYVKMLAEQGYTPRTVFDNIIDIITNYEDYPGISLAYEEEYGRGTSSEVEDFVWSYIEDVVAPEIESLGEDYEYDYGDVFRDLVDEDEDGSIGDLERSFEYLVDKKYKEWQDEIDDLNRWYDSQRM